MQTRLALTIALLTLLLVGSPALDGVEAPLATTGLDPVIASAAQGTSVPPSCSSQPGLTISPTAGPPGTVFSVSGWGFYTPQSISIGGSGLHIPTQSVSPTCRIAFQFDSISLPPGSYSLTVDATRYPSGPATVDASFQVTGGTPTPPSPLPVTCANPGASISPNSGPPGTRFAVSAQGFAPNQPVSVQIMGPTSAAMTGNVNANCQLPLLIDTSNDPPGLYTATMTGLGLCPGQGILAGGCPLTLQVQYQVTSSVPTNTLVMLACAPAQASISPASIRAGQRATITGNGFLPSSSVLLQVSGPSGSYLTTSVVASSSCAVSYSLITNPGDLPGRYLVSLSGQGSGNATASAATSFQMVGEAPAAAATPTAPSTPVIQPPTPTAALGTRVPPPPTSTPLPVDIGHSLQYESGRPVLVVGEPTIFRHQFRITNRGNAPIRVVIVYTRGQVASRLVYAASAQAGGTITVTFPVNDYADLVAEDPAARTGPPMLASGATVAFSFDVAPGETIVPSFPVQVVPKEADIPAPPFGTPSVSGSDEAGNPAPVQVLPPPLSPPQIRVAEPPPPPVDPVSTTPYFERTGFWVSDPDIWVYFNRRGGEKTFGAPISRLMMLDGSMVQLFERGLLGVDEEGNIINPNLLEEPFLPYDALGDTSLPPVDEYLLAVAPDPAADDYGAASQEFVRVHAADELDGYATRFYATFLSTVQYRDAYFLGPGDPALLPGFSLEIWGLPTSFADYHVLGPEDIDYGWVLQRFQRGVMQYDVAAGVASRLSLGDYFAQILKGEAAPALAEAAGSSPYWAQYNPDADYGIDRAEDLPDSDLTDVFEPEEGPAP